MQGVKRCWTGVIIAIGTMAIVLGSTGLPLEATPLPINPCKPAPQKPKTLPDPKPSSRQTERKPQSPKASVKSQPVAIELVDIPAGEFLMGSENGEDDEKPAHRVKINYAFKMGKYEVTQAQWQSVMGNNPSYFNSCGGNCPVEKVSWNDVQEFIKQLNVRNNGYTYRLPTEAEWEYACRAGTTGDFAGKLDAMAWYFDNSSGQTHPVGQKSPNAWGLYDIVGNVWEWCEDVYHDDYTGAPTDGSSWRTPRSDGENDRVLRGGTWYLDAFYCRSAFRRWLDADYRDYYLGFRVVAVTRK